MKTKVISILLLLVCIGLCFGLISVRRQAEAQHQQDVDKIAQESNQWTHTSAELDDQKQVNLTLEKDVAARKTDIAKLSNDLTQTSENLAKTEASLKAAMEETAKRDARIAELEGQKDALDKQAVDLRGSISSLETQITDTQKKLDASEGDKAFLTKELNRLMAEKAELERQFNDLAVLRAQVKKLKEELSVSRRLDWIRRGLFANQDEKGAQRLMQGALAAKNAAAAAATTNATDLNVEVHTDGSIKVIPPINTNAPPAPVDPAPKL